MIAARHAGSTAAGVTVVLWASAFVGIRAAGEELGPGPLTLARVGVAALVLGVFVAVRGDTPPPRRDVARLVFCGVLWLGAYNVLLNAAEQRIDAGTAAMLISVGPVILAALAGVLLGEGYPRSLVIGCGIALCGAVVTALCLAAAAAYAGGVIAQKPLLERTSPLQITFLACAAGAAACLPFAPALVREAGDASAGALLWTLYLGVVPTAIGFTTWAFALKRTSAGRLGATTYAVPPIAILLGWIVLGEAPPALALAGGLLCLAGVAVARGVRVRRRVVPA
jgi:drug/metabolite transporter (DMT)-like permease